MSNGDDEPADGDDGGDDGGGDDGGEVETAVTADSLSERLDEAEASLEEAETEADLDAVEATLDEVEADLAAADLPEPEDEEEDDPAEQLDSELATLREELEAQRGPYAEDVQSEIETAESTLTDTEWTETGESEVVAPVESFVETAGEHLDASFAVDDESPEGLAGTLADVCEAVGDAGLDPDEDAETIGALLGAAEELRDGLDDAEEWDDLTVREKLDYEGFYDVLDPENRKDYPPEWGAVKIYEKQYRAGENQAEAVDHVLTALDRLTSEFMQENILVSLKRMAPPEAAEELRSRAQRRTKPPIEILGKIGDEEALETLHDFIDDEGDVALQKTTLRAIGEIGSEESVEPVAQNLVADDEAVRSQAARTLGLLGDTRAIEPLADVLSDDDSDTVRASAAWALNQIGTERALEVVTDYTDDSAYIVQAEAEKALSA
ncbi:phycocyanobilin lyase [Halobacteriales archaeon QS_1_68_17]|nr:MAG: phycocyanobilin lyase [Halobacteriales archaeon QS_1_68_17]